MMSLGSREATGMVMHVFWGPEGMEGRPQQEDKEELTLGRMSLAGGRPVGLRGPLITGGFPVPSHPF